MRNWNMGSRAKSSISFNVVVVKMESPAETTMRIGASSIIEKKSVICR